jgi:hypothetical protein
MSSQATPSFPLYQLKEESVVQWMKGGEGWEPEVQGSGLLGKVRFPLMKEGYLAWGASGAWGAGGGDGSPPAGRAAAPGG